MKPIGDELPMTGTNHKLSTEIFGFARNPWLWLLTALIWPVAVSAQQDSMKACNLLSATELSAAIGGSVGHPSGIFLAKNPRLERNGDFWSCQEMVGARDVWIFFNILPVTDEGKKLQQAMQDRLRKQGYQVQTKEMSGSQCYTVLPPAGEKYTSVLVGTSCGREKGPYSVAVKVGATGPNDVASMEKVAALTQKAASRVPPQ